jgi:hypothetical protein
VVAAITAPPIRTLAVVVAAVGVILILVALVLMADTETAAILLRYG